MSIIIRINTITSWTGIKCIRSLL
ncbi:hypothetical protein BLA29_008445 [Euroglyphus maynei]|uniref:Uncharacterized protein n=1 Tax=Euroglyphus maynei TaxID=6958 RepID=A0A1Y3B386_EURMA|nr:hypothetical protein BLA29_008445 [Euroglyphus maynei]